MDTTETGIPAIAQGEQNRWLLRQDVAFWATAISFVVVAVLWIAFATEEPLHIDELRQLSGYDGGLDQWLETSWELNQPPLEIALGGTWAAVRSDRFR